MAGIKNIIFDFGGVLLNIDYNKTAEAFKQLGITDFEKRYSQYKADELFEKLETGLASETEFLKIITDIGKGLFNDSQVKQAWNAMLLDFRMDSFHYLEQLKYKYKTYLLSNTNAIHKAAFDQLFREQTGMNSIDSYFKKSWYSHDIGLRKPHSQIYQFVLKDENLLAEETFFIDDSVNNLEEAKKLGIITHLLLPGETIEKVVPHYLTSS